MEPYILVSCNFHDRLEALATRRDMCQIVYRNAADEVIEIQGQIVDVYAANK